MAGAARELPPGLSVEVVERCVDQHGAARTRRVEAARARQRRRAGARSVESAAFGRRAADLQPCLLVAEPDRRRGRMGRGWSSAPGASLTFSLSLPIAREDWSGLSLAVGRGAGRRARSAGRGRRAAHRPEMAQRSCG